MSKSDMQDKILKSWYSEKPILVSGSVIHRSARDSAKTLFLFETPMPSTHYAEGMRARNRRNRISVFGQDYRRLVFQEGTEHTELLFDQPPPEQDSRVLSDIEVFVSHAAHDAELTAAFVRLITTAIGIPDEAVRCTSVPKYKLKPGENSADTLRNDIQSCNVFIGVVTPRSMQRPFVLMEMGAAWAFNKTVIPLLAEDAQWSDVPSPFAGIHGVEASDRDGLVDLIESVTGALDYPAPTTKRVNAEISFFLKHLENR